MAFFKNFIITVPRTSGFIISISPTWNFVSFIIFWNISIYSIISHNLHVPVVNYNIMFNTVCNVWLKNSFHFRIQYLLFILLVFHLLGTVFIFPYFCFHLCFWFFILVIGGLILISNYIYCIFVFSSSSIFLVLSLSRYFLWMVNATPFFILFSF